MRSLLTLSVLVCFITGLAGCAAIGLSVPEAAAVSGGAAGVDYSFTNIAYKTMSYPIADVEAALGKALEKMEIRQKKYEQGKDGITIEAVTANLNIFIDLEKVTPTVTKIAVNAKKGFFIKDKSTATEIIVQTEKNLDEIKQ